MTDPPNLAANQTHTLLADLTEGLTVQVHAIGPHAAARWIARRITLIPTDRLAALAAAAIYQNATGRKNR